MSKISKRLEKKVASNMSDQNIPVSELQNQLAELKKKYDFESTQWQKEQVILKKRFEQYVDHSVDEHSRDVGRLTEENLALSDELSRLKAYMNSIAEAFRQNRSDLHALEIRDLSQIEEEGLGLPVLQRLMQSHDKEFIHQAFQVILGRDADSQGFVFYLAKLRDGLPKVDILYQLRRSKEAAQRSEPEEGFDKSVQRYVKEYKGLFGIAGRKNRATSRQFALLERSLLQQEERFSGQLKRLTASITRLYQMQNILDGHATVEELLSVAQYFDPAQMYEELNNHPAFDKAFYLANNKDVADGGHDPVMHYIMHGYVDNRSPNPRFSNDYHRLKFINELPADVNPLSYALRHPSKMVDYSPIKYKTLQKFGHPVILIGDDEQKINTSLNICVHIHVHYEDVFEEIVLRLGALKDCATLLLSCSHKSVFDALHKKYFDDPKVMIRMVENRGRDVAPMVVEFGSAILDYDLCLHLHTKKSKQTGEDVGRQWLDDIMSKIIDNESQIAQIIQMFESNPKLGVVEPLAFHKVVPSMVWMDNISPARDLLKKLSITTDVLMSFPLYFPAGTMIWFRPNALKQLLVGRVALSDFEPEPIGTNGTIAHAIERCINYIARHNGYEFATVSKRREELIETSSLKHLDIFDANCVFCSYSDQTFIPENVLHSLRLLSPYFKEIHLVTNLRALSNVNDLPSNVRVFLTENRGYDFGMYHRCIQHAQLRGKTFIMNDSVFMLSDPYLMLKRMMESNHDLMGFTLSYEVHPHVQSYCMTLSERALQEFLDYYAQNGDIDGRQRVIDVYELGFSNLLVSKGWSIGGVYEGKHMNPTIFDAQELLMKAGPIIKKKVVLNNWGQDEIDHLIRLNYNFDYDWLGYILKTYQVDMRELAMGQDLVL